MILFTFFFNLSIVLGSCPHLLSKKNSGNNALTAANDFMIQQYEETKTDFLSFTKDYPLIVLQDVNMTLYRNGKEDKKVTLEFVRYDNLKMVAHIPFSALLLTEPSVYLATDDHTPYPINQKDLKSIQTYLHIIENVIPELPICCNFSGEELNRQLELVITTKTFLSNVLMRKEVSKADIDKMANLTVPTINENIKQAVITYVDGLHSIVMSWKADMSRIEWEKLHVLFLSSHMPRNGSLIMQYFARLLHTPVTSGLRVIYAEHVDTLEEALDLLATHLVDFTAGQAFFRNKISLHSDVQGNATAEYLPKILPNTQNEDQIIKI